MIRENLTCNLKGMTAALIIISFIPVVLAVIAGYAFVSQP
ncbi:membrane protein [Mycobacterium phage Sagefire]|nr:membrane protein [Mycobacterium phage Sagefire]